MAAVVYECMVGGGGELFAGKKFFVLQRVPMREIYVDAIKKNGGEVVKFDKHADIIIADHVKRDNPVGAISWTFIDLSVKRGRLENIEDHRAGPKTGTVREVGSNHPPRSGRIPFTPQDDHDLLVWITKAERTGAPIKGNDIYKQLEAINPRHTFQSWRDRWIKQLSHRPRPEISIEEQSAAAGNPTRSIYSNNLASAGSRQSSPSGEISSEIASASPIKQETRVRTRPRITKRPAANQLKDKSAAVNATTVMPLVRKSTGGTNFTQAEADYMMENYNVMAEADQDMGVRAWARYSVDNPNHSAQEWHDYFVQTIEPLVRKQRQDSQAKAADTVAEDPTSSDMDDVVVPSRLYEATSARESTQIDVEPPTIVDPTTKDEELFVSDLSAMVEDEGYEANFEFLICGRKIRLFQLWELVNSHEFGGYDEVSGRNLWRRLAGKLNFNDFRHAEAADAIKSAYEVILPDFEVSREEFMREIREKAMIEAQLRATAERDDPDEDAADDDLALFVEEEEDDEEDDYDDDLEAPVSLPRQDPASSGKRSFDSNQNGSPVLGSYIKRQRIDKGKGREREIPSTPENPTQPSPTARSLYKSSPLKFQLSAAAEAREVDEVFQQQMYPPSLVNKIPWKWTTEPETQEFDFPPIEQDSVDRSLHLPNRQREKIVTSSAPSSFHGDSSTQSLTDSKKEKEMRDYLEHHIALGYPEEIVYKAFDSTSMSVGGATAIVMEELLKGNDIPKDMQGVWTSADDAAIEDVESVEFQRVCRKHGTKSVVLRQKFLDEKRDVMRELGD